jgi:hypothetical protein
VYSGNMSSHDSLISRSPTGVWILIVPSIQIPKIWNGLILMWTTHHGKQEASYQ